MKLIEQGTVLFERYKIMDLIGSGGSGQVYLAENVKVGNLVAIKAVDRKDQIQFLAEQNLLKELRHSAIPVIVDIEEDTTTIYLVEEYVEGTSLGTLKGQLSETEVSDIMAQLCDVLQYLHTSFETPIIYRDMKPDNIIRMANGRVKLIDFGIAIRGDMSETTEATHFGTRAYAAPEQLSYGKVSEKTDIYALGVCMYYMMTGKNLSSPPYRLQPLREVNTEVSQGFSEIISKCTETLPSKRYHSAEQLLRELKALYQGSDSQRDYRVFKERSSKVLTVAGVKRGIGCTHTAWLMAACFAEAGKKVALIEWQDREDFIKIASMNPDAIEEKRRFIFHGIEAYFHAGVGMYDKIITEDYDVMIVDGGTLEDLEGRGDEVLSEMLYVVCGSKDWEMDYFEEMFFAGLSRQRCYLFNFMCKDDIKTIQTQAQGFMCHGIPYNPNPYLPSEAFKEMMVLCTDMMPNQGIETVNKKGMFFYAKEWIQTQVKYITQK